MTGMLEDSAANLPRCPVGAAVGADGDAQPLPRQVQCSGGPDGDVPTDLSEAHERPDLGFSQLPWLGNVRPSRLRSAADTH